MLLIPHDRCHCWKKTNYFLYVSKAAALYCSYVPCVVFMTQNSLCTRYDLTLSETEYPLQCVKCIFLPGEM